MLLFEGKVGLVTGGARGQGRSHAVNLARHGADVAVLDICEQIPSVQYPMATDADLAETARLIEEEGRRALPIKADVRDYDAVAEAVKAVVGSLGRVDLVVANAGIMASLGAPGREIAAWHAAIDTMLSGVFYTVLEATNWMAEVGNGGSVVITGSTSSFEGVAFDRRVLTPGQVGYGAAKHGVLAIMRNFAKALGPLGVRVNLVAPGGVDTPMVRNENFDKFRAMTPPGWGVNAMNTELADSQDVSEAVIWLLSDLARYVTGTTIAVDSGHLLM